MALININYYSTVLGMNTNAVVSMPQKCDTFLSKGPRKTEDGGIPVLWLLHGMGDDCTGWVRFTSIEKYAEARGIAVVIPEVSSLCFYADMPKGLPYLTFITKEFPQFIREIFPTLSENPKYNFIAGCSMGGYGALKVALINPERYSAVGCFSSGNFCDLELPPVEYAPDFMKPIYVVPEVAFGVPTFKDSEGTCNDLRCLYEKNKGKRLPKIYQYAGTNDWLIHASDKLADYLRQRSAEGSYIYEKWDGEHNWKFWDEALPKFLDSCGMKSLFTSEQA